MTMEAIVKDVEARKIKNNTETIYDIVIQDGTKWTAWTRELAERAYGLKDTLALLEVEVKQNGNFTNRTLKSIAAKVDAGFAPALSAMEQSIGRTFTEAYIDSSPGPQFTEAPREGSGTEKDISIWRQVAGKVAGQISTDRTEFWENVEQLYNYFSTGIIPGRLLAELRKDPRGLDAGIPSDGQTAREEARQGPTLSFEDATLSGPDDDIPF